MDRPLRILILEDVASDAEMMAYEMHQAHLDLTWKRVEDEAGFVKELEEFEPDLILSDYHFPAFDGLAALALAQKKRPDAPFIFVSGAIGEEVAIDTLKRGATDYVLKSRLSRLVPAVKRALQEAEDRRERRQAVQALRESEQNYRLLVKSIPAVVFKGYLDWSVDFLDDKVEELTGYRKEDFNSRRLEWSKVVLPEDYLQVKQAFIEGLRTTKSYVREYRIRKKDGEPLWIQDRGQIVCDQFGQVDYISGVFFDITERKRAEEALLESEQRLRFLTSQLLTAQERERKRISMELHDELGQGLTVLKLQMRNIEKVLGQSREDLKQDCQHLLRYLDEVIDNVRRLSRDLSPAILEDLGLMSALKYLINEFDKHYEVSFSLEPENLNDLFPQEAQIIIYRIFQESLTNIYKHAQATRVALSIREQNGSISLMVEDNGTGFNIAAVLAGDIDSRGLGLAALDERARMLGGALHIWSQEGVGTKITCNIPVKQSNSEKAKA
jgi:two-component system sensor histidine kinase UhpB